MKGKASLAGALPVPADLLRKLRGKQKADESRNRRQVRNPSRESPSPSRFRHSPPPDPEILRPLKQWRGEIADEAGVPLHYILGNDTLTELARRRPKSREELLAIKGIGPVKAERYGTAFLEIVGEIGEEKRRREGKR